MNTSPVLHKWLIPCTVNWILIVTVILLAGMINVWVAYAVCIVLLGNLQHRIGIMGHEAGHNLACKNRRLNDLLGNVMCMYPFGLLTMEGYREFHFTHHRHMGKPGLDPEYIHKGMLPIVILPFSYIRLVRQFVTDCIGGGVLHILTAIYLTRARKAKSLVGPLVYWSIICLAAWWFDQLWVLAMWWISVYTSFWAFFRLRIWIEHVNTDSVQRVSCNWWQRLLFAPHSCHMHWEHHKSPSTPAWALQSIREKHTDIPVMSVPQLFATYQ